MTSLPGISTLARPIAPRWWARWMDVPRIVAESLTPVPDPVATALRPGPWAPAQMVARALARQLAPNEDPAQPPAWLRPEQVRSFRRAVHGVRRFGGVLIADPVGSGKTYVALAVAAALDPGRPATCIVPATLLEQWRASAEAVGVPVVVGSHQAASRGRLPARHRGVVVIDESHHFRNPRTRRYRKVASWLPGRPVVLVTATPVVNRLEDLLHQLLLGVRDDALAPDGVISLRSLLRGGQGSPGLGRLVVETTDAGPRPMRWGSVSVAGSEECAAAAVALESIGRLRLSRLPATAALVRSVLGRAAASSPAALAGALGRYRKLLLHARDAAGAGQPLDRAAIRRFTGQLEDQLIWWELMPPGQGATELELHDLEIVDEVIRDAHGSGKRPDGKVERLRALLSDGRPTLVFTTRRDTVRYLRDHLSHPPAAWCTGERAGLGHVSVPRDVVLKWFRENGSAAPPEVRHLLVTDVAAEGLDLQRAARVVHYDLPWTPMRLEQREGRAARLGSLHKEVEVVHFRPPAVIERALRIGRALASKARLPGAVGLGPSGGSLWRWRGELARAYADGEARAGVAVVSRGPAGVLAGFELYGLGSGGCVRLAAALTWIDPTGEWTEDERVIAARLADAARCASSDAPDPDTLRDALALIARPIRSRLALAGGSRWTAPEADPIAHRLSVRLHAQIRHAARRRDLAELESLGRALAFVGRGRTAGEASLLERVAQAPDAELSRAVARLPASPPAWTAIEARLGGVLLFVPR